MAYGTDTGVVSSSTAVEGNDRNNTLEFDCVVVDLLLSTSPPHFEKKMANTAIAIL